MIATAQFYYIASFFLTVSVESLLVVAEHAVEHNKARWSEVSFVCLGHLEKQGTAIGCCYPVLFLYVSNADIVVAHL